MLSHTALAPPPQAAQILIVEDEVWVAKDLQLQLEHLGYRVPAIVTLGTKVLTAVESLRPDLVLIDMHLQGPMDGVATAEQLRTRFQTPVIYLTADVDAATIQRAQLTEPCGYLPKPFAARELWEAIEVALYKHHLAEQLRQSEERYQVLFEDATDMILSCALTGEITSANREAERLLGCSREAIIGKHLGQFLDVTPNPMTHQLGGGLFDLLSVPSFEATLRNGATRPVIVEGKARLIHDEYGQPKEVWAIGRDISARKAAERSLQEEREVASVLARFGRELMEPKDSLVMLVRLCQLTAEVLIGDCACTMLWQEEEQMYVPVATWGHRPEEEELFHMLRVPSDAMHSLVGRLTNDEVIAASAGVSTGLFLEPLLSQLGWAQALCFAVWRENALWGIQICGYRCPVVHSPRDLQVARGISPIASLVVANSTLAQELQDANRLKDDFIGRMSHEFRTPLHIIFGYLDLLQEETFGPLTPEQKGSLQQARKSTQALLEIVESILSFRCLRRGAIAPDLQEVQLADFFATLTEEIVSCVGRSPAVTLQWPPADALPSLTTDPHKLKIIVKNLIANALQFTSAGAVTVSVARQGESIAITIEDTGSGIAPEALPLIFHPFWRGETATVQRHQGVGLGLALVRQLVEALRGTIKVTSEVGKGSTFCVTLPTVRERELI